MRILICLIFMSLGCEALAISAEKKKIRVLMISRMTEQQLTAFYALMEKENPLIDGSFRSSSFDDADVVAYLLDSWDEVEDAPGYSDIPELFSHVSRVKSPTFNLGTVVYLTDGREIKFIFYSAKDSDYAPLKCYAIDLAVEAGRTIYDTSPNDAFRECAGLK